MSAKDSLAGTLSELADNGLVIFVVISAVLVGSILALVITFTLLGISPREAASDRRACPPFEEPT